MNRIGEEEGLPDLQTMLAPYAVEERSYPGRTIIWHTGDHVSEIFLIRSGWAFRYNLLFDGRRQIFSIFTTGDLISPKLLVTPMVTYSLQSVTDIETLIIDRNRLNEAMSGDEALWNALSRLWYSQHLYYDERIIELGRLNAQEKISAFLVRLLRKMEWLDPDPNHEYEVPITREIISDTLGLTPVHVSRTMKRLESLGAVRWTRKSLKILDPQLLRSLLPKFYPSSTDFSKSTFPQV